MQMMQKNPHINQNVTLFCAAVQQYYILIGNSREHTVKEMEQYFFPPCSKVVRVTYWH